MYRIVIADDERMIREGLAAISWKENGIEVVGIVKNGIEAQELIDSTEFDVLLTDIRMPGISGLELAENLRKANPGAKTILLSGYGEFEYARKAIGLGVFGYILKPSGPKEIIEIVLNACRKIEEEREKSSSIRDLREKISDYEEVIGVEKVLEEKQTDIKDILSYIYHHYDQNLSLSMLAEEFHFSSIYLSSYIKRYTGHTFLEILTSVRMYHAAQLLRETRMKNREIGMRVGIPDERYFGQVFKKTYGITPYEYRKDSSNEKVSLEEFMRRLDS